MKRTVRFPAIFVCFLLMAAFVFPVRAFAAGSAIDTSTSSDGYFTVAYLSEEKAKMKVGVTQGTDTVYYDYVPGDASASTSRGLGDVYKRQVRRKLLFPAMTR